MIELPNYILVVICKYSKIDKDGVSEILKEYLNGMPYLHYTSDSNDTYYILPYINTFRAIMYNIQEMICVETIDVLGYSVYKRCKSSFGTYMKTNDREIYNYRYFPFAINIDFKHLETLKIFTEN